MHSSIARAGVQWNIPVESYLKKTRVEEKNCELFNSKGLGKLSIGVLSVSFNLNDVE